LKKTAIQRQTEALFEELRALDLKSVEARLVATLRRDETGSPTADGWRTTASGTGDGGSGGAPAAESSAVLAAVIAREEPVPDPIHVHAIAAAGELLAAVRALRALEGHLRRIDKLSDPNPREERGIALCAEPACDRPADPGKRGRCSGCYSWGWRWQQNHLHEGPPPPVPSEVIEEREARRARVEPLGV
jgi:hypothetical protein